MAGEMSAKNSRVKLLSIMEQKGGKIMMLAADSVTGPILQIGDTNSHCEFSSEASGFVNVWNSHDPAHHFAVGIVGITEMIDKLGKLHNMDVVKVC